jgi:hypothetical protein
VRVDPAYGGLASVVHVPSGQELVNPASGRSLGETVFYDGQERILTDVTCRARLGEVTAGLQIVGRIGDIRVTNEVTLHAVHDQVEIELSLEKPPTTNEQRLLQFFPLGDGARDLRIETTAAVLRPRQQPDGDLLAGADTRRFAVQGFVDYAPAGGVGATLAPLDAFMLRLDQGALAFEVLGNDQNWKEVTQDQDGVTRFRFRYALRAHAPGFNGAAALAWSRDVAAPLTLARGRLPGRWLDRALMQLDPNRGLVMCLKPGDTAEPNQIFARVWETAGSSEPLSLAVPGYRRATATDLLERDRGALAVSHGAVSLATRPHGFSAVKLER